MTRPTSTNDKIYEVSFTSEEKTYRTFVRVDAKCKPTAEKVRTYVRQVLTPEALKEARQGWLPEIHISKPPRDGVEALSAEILVKELPVTFFKSQIPRTYRERLSTLFQERRLLRYVPLFGWLIGLVWAAFRDQDLDPEEMLLSTKAATPDLLFAALRLIKAQANNALKAPTDTAHQEALKKMQTQSLLSLAYGKAIYKSSKDPSRIASKVVQETDVTLPLGLWKQGEEGSAAFAPYLLRIQQDVPSGYRVELLALEETETRSSRQRVWQFTDKKEVEATVASLIELSRKPPKRYFTTSTIEHYSLLARAARLLFQDPSLEGTPIIPTIPHVIQILNQKGEEQAVEGTRKRRTEKWDKLFSHWFDTAFPTLSQESRALFEFNAFLSVLKRAGKQIHHLPPAKARALTQTIEMLHRRTSKRIKKAFGDAQRLEAGLRLTGLQDVWETIQKKSAAHTCMALQGTVQEAPSTLTLPIPNQSQEKEILPTTTLSPQQQIRQLYPRLAEYASEHTRAASDPSPIVDALETVNTQLDLLAQSGQWQAVEEYGLTAFMFLAGPNRNFDYLRTIPLHVWPTWLPALEKSAELLLEASFQMGRLSPSTDLAHLLHLLSTCGKHQLQRRSEASINDFCQAIAGKSEEELKALAAKTSNPDFYFACLQKLQSTQPYGNKAYTDFDRDSCGYGFVRNFAILFRELGFSSQACRYALTSCHEPLKDPTAIFSSISTFATSSLQKPTLRLQQFKFDKRQWSTISSIYQERASQCQSDFEVLAYQDRLIALENLAHSGATDYANFKDKKENKRFILVTPAERMTQVLMRLNQQPRITFQFKYTKKIGRLSWMLSDQVVFNSSSWDPAEPFDVYRWRLGLFHEKGLLTASTLIHVPYDAYSADRELKNDPQICYAREFSEQSIQNISPVVLASLESPLLSPSFLNEAFDALDNEATQRVLCIRLQRENLWQTVVLDEALIRRAFELNRPATLAFLLFLQFKQHRISRDRVAGELYRILTTPHVEEETRKLVATYLLGLYQNQRTPINWEQEGVYLLKAYQVVSSSPAQNGWPDWQLSLCRLVREIYLPQLLQQHPTLQNTLLSHLAGKEEIERWQGDETGWESASGLVFDTLSGRLYEKRGTTTQKVLIPEAIRYSFLYKRCFGTYSPIADFSMVSGKQQYTFGAFIIRASQEGTTFIIEQSIGEELFQYCFPSANGNTPLEKLIAARGVWISTSDPTQARVLLSGTDLNTKEQFVLSLRAKKGVLSLESASWSDCQWVPTEDTPFAPYFGFASEEEVLYAKGRDKRSVEKVYLAEHRLSFEKNAEGRWEYRGKPLVTEPATLMQLQQMTTAQFPRYGFAVEENGHIEAKLFVTPTLTPLTLRCRTTFLGEGEWKTETTAAGSLFLALKSAQEENWRQAAFFLQQVNGASFEPAEMEHLQTIIQKIRQLKGDHLIQLAFRLKAEQCIAKLQEEKRHEWRSLQESPENKLAREQTTFKSYQRYQQLLERQPEKKQRAIAELLLSPSEIAAFEVKRRSPLFQLPPIEEEEAIPRTFASAPLSEEEIRTIVPLMLPMDIQLMAQSKKRANVEDLPLYPTLYTLLERFNGLLHNINQLEGEELDRARARLDHISVVAMPPESQPIALLLLKILAKRPEEKLLIDNKSLQDASNKLTPQLLRQALFDAKKQATLETVAQELSASLLSLLLEKMEQVPPEVVDPADRPAPQAPAHEVIAQEQMRLLEEEITSLERASLAEPIRYPSLPASHSRITTFTRDDFHEESRDYRSVNESLRTWLGQEEATPAVALEKQRIARSLVDQETILSIDNTLLRQACDPLRESLQAERHQLINDILALHPEWYESIPESLLFERFLDHYQKGKLEEQLFRSVTLFLWGAIELQQLDRVLQEETQESIDALYRSIDHTRYNTLSSMEIVTTLLAEFRSGQVLRAVQPDIIHELATNPHALILSATGTGKSTKVFPAAAFLIAQKEEGILPILILTDSLFQTGYKESDFTTRTLFKQAGHCFDFTVKTPIDALYLAEEYRHLLLARQQRKYVVTTLSRLEAVDLTIQSLLKSGKDPAALFWLQKIRTLLADPTNTQYLIDEIDDTYRPDLDQRQAIEVGAGIPPEIGETTCELFMALHELEEGQSLRQGALAKAVCSPSLNLALRRKLAEKFTQDEETIEFLLDDTREPPHSLEHTPRWGVLRKLLAVTLPSMLSLEPNIDFGPRVRGVVERKANGLAQPGMRFSEPHALAVAHYSYYSSAPVALEVIERHWLEIEADLFHDQNPLGDSLGAWYRREGMHLAKKVAQQQLIEKINQEMGLRLFIVTKYILAAEVHLSTLQSTTCAEVWLKGLNVSGASSTINLDALGESFSKPSSEEIDHPLNHREVLAKTLTILASQYEEGLDHPMRILDLNADAQLHQWAQDPDCKAIVDQIGLQGARPAEEIAKLLHEAAPGRQILFTHSQDRLPWMWNPDRSTPEPYNPQQLQSNRLVYFGCADCRGTDKPIAPGTVVYALGSIQEEEFVQTLGRARQAGKGHRLELFTDPRIAQGLGHPADLTIAHYVDHLLHESEAHRVQLNLQTQQRQIQAPLAASLRRTMAQPGFQDPTLVDNLSITHRLTFRPEEALNAHHPQPVVEFLLTRIAQEEGRSVDFPEVHERLSAHRATLYAKSPEQLTAFLPQTARVSPLDMLEQVQEQEEELVQEQEFELVQEVTQPPQSIVAAPHQSIIAKKGIYAIERWEEGRLYPFSSLTTTLLSYPLFQDYRCSINWSNLQMRRLQTSPIHQRPIHDTPYWYLSVSKPKQGSFSWGGSLSPETVSGPFIAMNARDVCDCDNHKKYVIKPTFDGSLIHGVPYYAFGTVRPSPQQLVIIKLLSGIWAFRTREEREVLTQLLPQLQDPSMFQMLWELRYGNKLIPKSSPSLELFDRYG